MMKPKKYTYLSLVLVSFMAAFSMKAQAQGTSSMQRDELLGLTKTQKWHGSASFSSAKNQDYYSDAYMTAALELSYELSADLSFYTEIDYRRPYSSVEEIVERYGFSDLDIGLSQRLFSYQFDNSVATSVSGFIGGSLPTSDASRRSSLDGATDVGFTTFTTWKRLIFSTIHSFTYNFYEYETVDVDGSAYNDEYMISNGAGITWRITSQINWSNSYRYYYLMNYADNDSGVQSGSTALSYIYDRNFTISAFLSWKDNIKTNNALFDDDNTYAGAGIRYVF